MRAKNQEASPDDVMKLAILRRWKAIGVGSAKNQLLTGVALADAHLYRQNIENYIGAATVPVGIAGPLRVHGAHGCMESYLPLATTEAALVASYNRGSQLINAAGGCHARVLDEGVSRTPMFAFETLVDAVRFGRYVEESLPGLQRTVTKHTNFGRLKQIRAVIEGNHVYLDFCFSTCDAAGQNMVTFVTDALVRSLLATAPVHPRYWFLEANLSGDKKATTRSLASVRGKRVSAEVCITRDLVKARLHTTPDRMVDYWKAGAIGAVMSGATGVQGHFANGLAALFLACGQDVACVAEAAVGITRMDIDEDGSLYACVTLPNLIVGTVGGGTALPSAQACLDILGLPDTKSAIAFSEICAGLVLAGELSIIGAFCSDDFAAAHRALSRGEDFGARGASC